MKNICILFALIPFLSVAQKELRSTNASVPTKQYVTCVETITQDAAFDLLRFANEYAAARDKKISIAILDASGSILVLVRGEGVGPHNTEASRRKAYTALSTKTASFVLMQKASKDSTAHNLNTLPELLLLGGGVPIWKDGVVLGSIGVSGAGGGAADHEVAQQAVDKLGLAIKK